MAINHVKAIEVNGWTERETGCAGRGKTGGKERKRCKMLSYSRLKLQIGAYNASIKL